MIKLQNTSDKPILVSFLTDDGATHKETVEPNGTVLVPAEEAKALTDLYLSGEWGVVNFKEVTEG